MHKVSVIRVFRDSSSILFPSFFGDENLLRSEKPIPRIAQARQDIAGLVELSIDGGRVDDNVRVGSREDSDALGRGDETKKLDVFTAFFFDPIDRRDRAPPRGEHRIDQDDLRVGELFGKLPIIVNRLQRVRVSVDADVTHLGWRWEGARGRLVASLFRRGGWG